MRVEQKWTIQMKNSIDAVMLPQTDPFDKAVFYVSDGLRSTFSSMRFRKLSMETGEEQANVLTRDGTRCIYCDKEYIYAFLNKRILKLHRSDLTIADEYKERIPRYTDYVDSDGAEVFLLGNQNADSLSVFHLQTGRSQRKKIGGCCGIFQTEPDTFFIFNYDSILAYSLKGNRLKKIADTEHYTECARGKSGRAYLLCGGVRYSTMTISSAEYKILIYSFVPDIKMEKVIFIPKEICGRLCSAMAFRLSEDEKRLYLFDSRTIWIYSICEDKIIFQHTFSAHILNVLAEESFVITSCSLQKGYEVAGWGIL